METNQNVRPLIQEKPKSFTDVLTALDHAKKTSVDEISNTANEIISKVGQNLSEIGGHMSDSIRDIESSSKDSVNALKGKLTGSALDVAKEFEGVLFSKPWIAAGAVAVIACAAGFVIGRKVSMKPNFTIVP